MFDLENFPTRELAKDMMSMISPIYDNSYVGKMDFRGYERTSVIGAGHN